MEWRESPERQVLRSRDVQNAAARRAGEGQAALPSLERSALRLTNCLKNRKHGGPPTNTPTHGQICVAGQILHVGLVAMLLME
jgi:hypothetical protein